MAHVETGAARRVMIVLSIIVILSLFCVGYMADQMRSRGLAHVRGEMRRSCGNLATLSESWADEHMGQGCPSVEELIEEKYLPPQFSRNDAWGTPFELDCRPGEIQGYRVLVTSAGQDKTFGTMDDISTARRTAAVRR